LISVLNDLWELLGDNTDYFITLEDYFIGTGVILDELTIDCLLSWAFFCLSRFNLLLFED